MLNSFLARCWPLPFSLLHGYTPLRPLGGCAGQWWVIKCVTGMRVKDGKREWRVEWDGTNPATKKRWPDDWLPTARVSEEARHEYLEAQSAARRRDRGYRERR